MLEITEEGKLGIDDFRSIHRAILTVLSESPKTMFQLVKQIQKEYHDLKYLKMTVIRNALSELLKGKYIISTYTNEEEDNDG